MPSTVFFSWQADTPTREGRNLIERALDRAAGRLGGDTTIEEPFRDLSVDRDTKNVPGSPPIVETIFAKIDKAAVFVPDLTFVGTRADGRPTPNPNVLIEYGWALKSLRHGRIVPVMNTAFGEPTAEAMPFNLRHLRNPILYCCPSGSDDETRKRARELLAARLEHALRAVFTSEQLGDGGPPEPPAISFSAHPSEDGPGKFRARGRPIGLNDGRLGEPPIEVRLTDGPVVWFRLMPKVTPDRAWLVTDVKNVATRQNTVILPFNNRWAGYSYLRSDDGFGVYGISDDRNRSEFNRWFLPLPLESYGV